MKLTPNENVLRVALVVFSILFGILSICLIALGIIYIDQLYWPRRFIGLDFMELPTLLITLGALSLIMSIIGCVCAKSYNRKLFMTFVFLLTVILALELVVAIVCFQNVHGLQEKHRKVMKEQFINHDNSFGMLENHYQCCGVTGTETECLKNETIPEIVKANDVNGCFDIVDNVIKTIAMRVGLFSVIIASLRIVQIACGWRIKYLMLE